LTKILLTTGENIVPFWITLGCFVAGLIVVFTILSSSAGGRRFKESLLLRIPVLGRLYHSSVLSKLAEGMAMMVAAGCDMPSCLRLGSTAAGSEKLVLESDMLACQIEQGANILEAGQSCRLIPRLFLYSAQLGAQRNELQDNLHSLGQMYSEQTRHRQAKLQTVLLPVMVVVLGSFVAMAVAAIFLPIMRLITMMASV
jgi:type IV pilus assembly protein PilC